MHDCGSKGRIRAQISLSGNITASCTALAHGCAKQLHKKPARQTGSEGDLRLLPQAPARVHGSCSYTIKKHLGCPLTRFASSMVDILCLAWPLYTTARLKHSLFSRLLWLLCVCRVGRLSLGSSGIYSPGVTGGRWDSIGFSLIRTNATNKFGRILLYQHNRTVELQAHRTTGTDRLQGRVGKANPPSPPPSPLTGMVLGNVISGISIGLASVIEELSSGVCEGRRGGGVFQSARGGHRGVWGGGQEGQRVLHCIQAPFPMTGQRLRHAISEQCTSEFKALRVGVCLSVCSTLTSCSHCKPRVNDQLCI